MRKFNLFELLFLTLRMKISSKGQSTTSAFRYPVRKEAILARIWGISSLPVVRYCNNVSVHVLSSSSFSLNVPFNSIYPKHLKSVLKQITIINKFYRNADR